MTGVPWGDFAAAEPEFAARVEQLLRQQKHMTLATLRADGSPRISGTEVQFGDDGELKLGSMAGALKARDLQRDPRFALHSPTYDAPEGNDSAWPGDAKLAGTVVELPPGEDGSHAFALRLTEVSAVKVGDPADHLVITSWRPGEKLRVRKRT